MARSFTLTAFAMFIDTLRLASDETDKSGRINADWEVLSNTRHLVTSSCGVQVSPTSSFLDRRSLTTLSSSGGRLIGGQAVDNETLRYLRDAASKGARLIGVCTGTFVLAEAGLMAEHETCVSWLHYVDFRERFPDLKVRADRIYNLDTARGSCAGGSSTADFVGRTRATAYWKRGGTEALEVLQIDEARNAKWVQPHRPLRIETQDPRLHAALILMEQNIENTMSVSLLASALGISRRQLEVCFQGDEQLSCACLPTRAAGARQATSQESRRVVDRGRAWSRFREHLSLREGLPKGLRPITYCLEAFGSYFAKCRLLSFAPYVRARSGHG